MSSALLHPTTVYKNGSFVADGTWADASDATSVTIIRTTDSSGAGGSQNAHGWVPPLVSDGQTAQAIIFHIRASATSTNPESSFQWSPQITFGNPGGGGSAPGTDLICSGPSIATDGTAYDIAYTATESDYENIGLDIGEVQARLSGGSGTSAGLRTIRHRLIDGTLPDQPVSTTRSLVIYECYLEIVWRSNTSRRKYPNPTGLGVGTRRHWPKPRRGVTGIN